jgi:peptide/nickel transport system permease protein
VSLLIGGGIVGVYVLAIFLAPVIAPHSPDRQDVSAILTGPSGQHWLGTDQLGRDVWARLVYSVRIDVPVSILAVVVPFVVGTLLGMVAGHGGGVLDAVIMRIADVVLAFPFMVLVIAFVFVFGSGVTSVFIAFSATGWVSYTIISRGESMTESNLEYVLAARTLGYPRRRILLRHLLPNVITQGILYAMSDMVMTVTSIVGLGFLGLGIRPPTPEWGSMIADGTPFITTHWLIATAPGLAVVVFGIGLSMIGDGLASLLKAG